MNSPKEKMKSAPKTDRAIAGNSNAQYPSYDEYDWTAKSNGAREVPNAPMTIK